MPTLLVSPTLYIFSGLPGTGKTTLAKAVARHLKAAYFRLDTIEHALQEVCSLQVRGEGYRLTQRLVADNLGVGNDVVVDCCNPWELTRAEWERAATENGGDFINIEVICTDQSEHQARVAQRESDIAGFTSPTWAAIQAREYQAWQRARIVMDTSHRDSAACIAELLQKLAAEKGRLTA